MSYDGQPLHPAKNLHYKGFQWEFCKLLDSVKPETCLDGQLEDSKASHVHSCLQTNAEILTCSLNWGPLALLPPAQSAAAPVRQSLAQAPLPGAVLGGDNRALCSGAGTENTDQALSPGLIAWIGFIMTKVAILWQGCIPARWRRHLFSLGTRLLLLLFKG